MEPLQIEIIEEQPGKATARINGLVAQLRRYQLREDQRHDIYFADEKLLSWLCAYPIRDLGVHFSVVQFWTQSLLDERGGDVRVSFEASRILIILDIPLRLLQWNSPWSAMTYSEVMADVGRRHDLGVEGIIHNVAQATTYLSIFGSARSSESILGEEILHLVKKFRVVEEEATTQLIAAQHADSLTTTFHFPPAIATACEQYLLYFVQFLRDLGIEAQAEVKHEAAEVLFRVTPTAGHEALERVHAALDAYLSFPTDPHFPEESSRAPGIAVRQLRAQVSFLQSQVEIGKALLEAKDARIEALELSNFRLREIGGDTVSEAAPSRAVGAVQAGAQSLDVTPSLPSEETLPANRNTSILWTLDRLL